MRGQLLGDIIPKQVEVQGSIQAGLMGAITPALGKVGTTIAPVIEAMAKPLYKAYRVAVRIYMTEMQKVCGACRGVVGVGVVGVVAASVCCCLG